MAFSQPIQLRYSDLDALGHVNHRVFLDYLEVARTRWWGPFLGDRPFPEEGFVIARVEVDYRQSIVLGDQVRVELRCSGLGRTSFTLSYRLVREPDETLVAEALTVQVMMDFAAMRPRPLGPAARTWLQSQS